MSATIFGSAEVFGNVWEGTLGLTTPTWPATPPAKSKRASVAGEGGARLRNMIFKKIEVQDRSQATSPGAELTSPRATNEEATTTSRDTADVKWRSVLTRRRSTMDVLTHLGQTEMLQLVIASLRSMDGLSTNATFTNWLAHDFTSLTTSGRGSGNQVDRKRVRPQVMERMVLCLYDDAMRSAWATASNHLLAVAPSAVAATKTAELQCLMKDAHASRSFDEDTVGDARDALTDGIAIAPKLAGTSIPAVRFSEDGVLSVEWKRPRGGVLIVMAGGGTPAYSIADDDGLYSLLTEFTLDAALPARLGEALDPHSSPDHQTGR